MVAGAPLDRRLVLAHTPTPVERLDRLAAHLGKPPGTVWAKRDDLTGLGGGGNKARKLEYLCADALDQGCDTLVTGGGVQSNHVRMTAAAANRLGLACTIVVAGSEPEVPAGNVVLDELLGPEIVWSGGDGHLSYEQIEARIVTETDRLRRRGRRPYGMPIGGASTVGALGYARAAMELLDQLPETSVVVVADGSGGTHAGLLAGFGASHVRVLGVNVGARDDLDAAVADRAAATAVALDSPPPSPSAVWIDHEQAGPGYGIPVGATRHAMRVAARCEGIILDPVYTGKAMAGLFHACHASAIDRAETVVFVHTGGLPALFAPPFPTWLRAPD